MDVSKKMDLARSRSGHSFLSHMKLSILLAAVGVLWHCGIITSPAQTIVTFGDSVTAVRGHTEVYSTLLASDLAFSGKEVKVINAGIGGNTTSNGMARLQKDVLAHQPDVAVIMFGINDAAVDV